MYILTTKDCNLFLQGLCALHYACASGNSEALIHLFDYLTRDDLAALMAPAGPGGVTPFHLAALSGQADVVIMLHSKVKNPNAADAHGRTPLHVAAARGHAEVAKTLLHKGALVAVHDSGEESNKGSVCGGQTPVHYASAGGHATCLRLLLENTEDVSVADAKDSLGQTPLMLAAERGNVKLVNKLKDLLLLLLMQCMMRVSFLLLSLSFRCASELLNYNAAVDASDNNGRTALMRAAYAGQEELVELLLERGANATEKWDSGGKTAFHLAAACGQGGVLMLLAETEEKEKLETLRDKRGFTPLHWAAYGGHEGCVDFLLNSIRKFPENAQGFSPIHCAV